MGKGEIDYNDPRVPDSVKQGRRGGLEQAGGQGDILEAGLKGATGVLPPNEGTEGSIDTRLPKWDDHD